MPDTGRRREFAIAGVERPTALTRQVASGLRLLQRGASCALCGQPAEVVVGRDGATVCRSCEQLRRADRQFRARR
jgi:hypothetical protein